MQVGCTIIMGEGTAPMSPHAGSDGCWCHRRGYLVALFQMICGVIRCVAHINPLSPCHVSRPPSRLCRWCVCAAKLWPCPHTSPFFCSRAAKLHNWLNMTTWAPNVEVGHSLYAAHQYRRYTAGAGHVHRTAPMMQYNVGTHADHMPVPPCSTCGTRTSWTHKLRSLGCAAWWTSITSGNSVDRVLLLVTQE